MWQILRRDPRAFGAALLLHLVLAALTLVSVDWLATADKAPTKLRVVQATIVDSKAIEAGGRQAEARRTAEEKARRQAEARRTEEEKARRQAEARRTAEKETEAQRAREEALQAALEAEQAASNLGVYKREIRERIHRIWVRQPGMGWDLSCGVEVRLIPGGEVIPGGVRVTHSSGNPTFDQSVVTAVYKASPLPVPSGRPFEQFRNLRLLFKP